MVRQVLFIFLISPFLIFAKKKRETEYDLIYKEVKKTFSINPEEVVEGVYKIGEMKIEKAIPLILRLLSDERIVWLKYDGTGKWTKIDKEVEEALIKIGKNSLKYLYALLVKNEYPYVELDEKTKEKIAGIVSKITGRNLKDIDDFSEILEE
ncbi:MAG: hypothetical protein ACP5OB_04985 [Candidatus Ratteibacteria bacterium]